MNLKKFISSLSKDELADFAKRCDTSVAYLKKVAGGFGSANAPGESLAINIERESNGIVTVEELRPDVDWAFIRGSSVA